MTNDEIKRIARIAGLMKGKSWNRENLDVEHLRMFLLMALEYAETELKKDHQI
jgi:hypothetical protein